MRRERARYYDDNLRVREITTPALAYERECHTYHQYVISVSERRDELIEFLAQHQIGTAVYYPLPFHQQECFRDLGHKTGDFPLAEYAAQHTLALPMFPELTPEQQDVVIQRIKEFYE